MSCVLWHSPELHELHEDEIEQDESRCYDDLKDAKIPAKTVYSKSPVIYKLCRLVVENEFLLKDRPHIYRSCVF